MGGQDEPLCAAAVGGFLAMACLATLAWRWALFIEAVKEFALRGLK
jgi:hypothetical protein